MPHMQSHCESRIQADSLSKIHIFFIPASRFHWPNQHPSRVNRSRLQMRKPWQRLLSFWFFLLMRTEKKTPTITTSNLKRSICHCLPASSTASQRGSGGG